MVLGKKLAKESMLPSVQEARDTDLESEGSSTGTPQLGGISGRPASRPGKPFSRGGVDYKIIPRSAKSKSVTNTSLGSEQTEQQDSPAKVEERQPLDDNQEEELNGPEVDWDTDLESGETRTAYDPSGRTMYLEACKVYGVVPASYFLLHIQDPELNMMHHGLGPQGAKALAVPLVTNTFIVKLSLQDNWLEGEGGAAIAEMLKENCYITELDLSDNKLGVTGAQALSSMLLENSTLVGLNLSGNEFDDHATKHLAEVLVTNQKVETLDLSHNRMADGAGEAMGHAIAENTRMKDLNLSWNCFRGKGAISVAKGLGANIFLRVVDLSYNGFGKDGAAALGDALKVNNVLEELNISNNRIPPEGAVRLAMGLKENKTLKVLNLARNPFQTAGCYAVLKSLQGNPESAIESLDFSDITVNTDFDDLYKTVKEAFPGLQIKHGGNADMFKRAKAKTDPLSKLKEHMKEKNLQLEDIFESAGEDDSPLITREEFQRSLLTTTILLSQEELQSLMDTLDKNNEGQIDFSELKHLVGHA
ncbi:leucine-rich repeat-containing protein 74B [Erpetoichthys calabaricus]|uniref:leucine-rich repeat-containing protein 74B n=1 Tax=Erpetoichthys calabaricus TaxID=27687 RepID=UPI0010A035E3|nr:leucine-rich repeat-containing protein 74B [Erpetoichthys calabaricus]